MRKTHILIIAIVLYGIVGDLYFRNFFHMFGLVVTGLFVLFLIVHAYMDHKGKFIPKRKNEEG